MAGMPPLLSPSEWQCTVGMLSAFVWMSILGIMRMRDSRACALRGRVTSHVKWRGGGAGQEPSEDKEGLL